MNLSYQLRRTLHAVRRYLGDGDPVLLGRRVVSALRNLGPALRGEITSGLCTLEAVVTRADGRVENLGVICRRKVSAHFVQQIVAAMADATQTTQKWVTLATYKYMGCGTGVTAEGASGADYALGTEIVDNARTAGTITDVSVNPAGKFQVVGTYAFTAAGPQAVTEFGLFTGTDRNKTTKNGAQAANATPLLVASTTGFAGAGNIFAQGQVIAYTSVDATNFIGCSQGNAAITLANARGITAAGMLDRKVFAAINVYAADSIQFTYTLTINPET